MTAAAERPGVRAGLFLLMYGFGFTLTMIAPLLPRMVETFSLTLAQGSAFTTLMNVGGVCGVALAALLGDRLRKSSLFFAGYAVLFLGLLAVSLADGFMLMLALFFVMGVGSRVADTMSNPLIVENYPGRAGRYLSMMHMSISLGGLSGPVALRWLMNQDVTWQSTFRYLGGLCLVLFAVGFVLVRGAGGRGGRGVGGRFKRGGTRSEEARGDGAGRTDSRDSAARTLIRSLGMTEEVEDGADDRVPAGAPARTAEPVPPPLWRDAAVLVPGLMILFYSGHQVVLNVWSAMFMEEVFALPPLTASLSTTLFWAGIALSRWICSRFTSLRDIRTLVRIGALVGAPSLAAAVLSPHPALTIAGFSLTGLATGATIPLLIHLATRGRAGRSGRISGTLYLFSMAANMTFPWLCGRVADGWGFRAGLMVSALSLGVVLLLSLLLSGTEGEA